MFTFFCFICWYWEIGLASGTAVALSFGIVLLLVLPLYLHENLNMQAINLLPALVLVLLGPVLFKKNRQHPARPIARKRFIDCPRRRRPSGVLSCQRV